MDDNRANLLPKVKIKVTATIHQTYEIDGRFFDIDKDFGGRIPTKSEMIDKQAEYLVGDCTSLWEDGEIDDIKVVEVHD